MNISFLKYHKFTMPLLLTGIILYVLFGYDLKREDFIKLITLYTALFLISFILIQLKKNNFWFLAGTALFFRLILIGALPNLSQDFYRFIWDGKLILEGFNPYLYTPNELIQQVSTPEPTKQKLIEGMGALSAGNFTSYPPVNQLFFMLSVLFGGKSILGSVIVMRIFIIAADIGTLFFGKKLLERLRLPVHRIFWYILNPFIIIELTGNLHFEGVMIFFLLWSLYLLHKKKWIWSAVLLGISVSVKLLPLLFLPLLLNYFSGKKKTPTTTSPELNEVSNTVKAHHLQQKHQLAGFPKLAGYYSLLGITLIVSFLPFLSSEVISNFLASISLWFQKFEFNASFYYFIRWIGFQLKGYNIIETAGKILPLIVIGILAVLSFFRKNNSTQKLITTMLLGVSAYFFLSTTVHPWYIATPLILSVFTEYRYVLLWSFLIFLSYSVYSNAKFEENLWLVALEYALVIGFFVYENLKMKPANS